MKRNKSVTGSVSVLHSHNKVDLKAKTKRHYLRYLCQHPDYVTEMNDDNSFTVGTSSIAAQKRDPEIQITNIQSQLHFLKREGQNRFNGADRRILKYRPDKRTRVPIAELEMELLILNQARSSMDTLPEETEFKPGVSKRAEMVVRDVIAKQTGIG